MNMQRKFGIWIVALAVVFGVLTISRMDNTGRSLVSLLLLAGVRDIVLGDK